MRQLEENSLQQIEQKKQPYNSKRGDVIRGPVRKTVSEGETVGSDMRVHGCGAVVYACAAPCVNFALVHACVCLCDLVSMHGCQQSGLAWLVAYVCLAVNSSS